jgi:predicted Rossmann fold nucleotide-binding protein DprA/Smf involved in DNA uptake
MKSTEILNKIKTFLGEEKIEEQVEETQLEEQVEESTEEVKLAQATLENGTILEAEAFEAGNEIFIVTEDERVAVPVGEYLMEDGQMLVVSEEGIIGEIKSAEAEEEVEAEEEEMAYVSKEEFNSAIDEIKGMINELKEVKEEMAEVEEQVKQELSETPAVEPISHNPEAKQEFKVNFGQNRPETALDRVMKKLTNN